MQLALQFQDEPKGGDDLATLCVFLRQRRNWTKAKTIADELGFSDRKTRAIASQSLGLIVSGPGSPGYKHVACCTGEEIDHIASKLQAQAKLMSSRAGDIRAAWHRQDKP